MAGKRVQDRKEYQTIRESALKSLFPENSEVTGIVTHVAKSGMGRCIKILAVDGNGIFDASYTVASVLNWKYDRDNGGVWVDGCGMDMVSHLVYTMANKLYADGYALKPRSL